MNTPTNHRRADHKVHFTPGGFCVKFDYRGYEISLAADGEQTAVFKSVSDKMIFQTSGTSVIQIAECVRFVDGLTH